MPYNAWHRQDIPSIIMKKANENFEPNRLTDFWETMREAQRRHESCIKHTLQCMSDLQSCLSICWLSWQKSK